GQAVFCVRAGVDRGNQACRVADAQGDLADHRCRICVRVRDGAVFMVDRCGVAMGSTHTDGAGRFMSKKWYVVHAYSGFEKSGQRALIDRVPRAGMQAQFGQILVPVEEVVEMKSGQKNISERKFFPGYVLVEMEMTDDTWHLVKSTAKVTGFVGGTSTKP